jgi:hypothetical protein
MTRILEAERKRNDRLGVKLARAEARAERWKVRALEDEKTVRRLERELETERNQHGALQKKYQRLYARVRGAARAA